MVQLVKTENRPLSVAGRVLKTALGAGMIKQGKWIRNLTKE